MKKLLLPISLLLTTIAAMGHALRCNNYQALFVALFISLFQANGLAQEYSKKQQKIDLKELQEKISPPESYDEISKLRNRTNYSELTFIADVTQSNVEEILLISEENLYRFLPLQEVHRVGKYFYVGDQKYGNESTKPRAYPKADWKIMKVYSLEHSNPYNNEKTLFRMFQYEDLADNQVQHVILKEEDYKSRLSYLGKQLRLKELIEKAEFNISMNTFFRTDSHDFCEPFAFCREDFITITTLENDSIKKSCFDNLQNMKGYPESFQFKSKALNVELTYWDIKFELDSLRYFHLDAVELMNYVLRDTLKGYWGKPASAGDIEQYYDFTKLFDYKHSNEEIYIDKFTRKEQEKMASSSYWEKAIPSGKDFEKFLSVKYLRLPLVINENEPQLADFYKGNLQIVDTLRLSFIKIDGKDDPRSSTMLVKNSGPRYFEFSSVDPNVIRTRMVTTMARVFCNKIASNNYAKLQKQKDDQYKKELAAKYGMKYVEAALVGDIIVGMPEDLLSIPLRVWSIESTDRWDNGYTIWCKFRLDTSKRLKVTVMNGKVSNFSTW